MASGNAALDFQTPTGTSRAQSGYGEGLNVALWERIASAAAGGFLLAWGIRKRSPVSIAGAALGADLIYRGVTGHCQLYGLLDVNTAASDKPGSQVSPDAPEVERSITIGKSPQELYEFWRDPINLAQIVAHFAEVTPKPGGVTHWRLRGPLQQIVEWDSHYTEEQPGRKLAWETIPGSTLVNRGEIAFETAPNGNGSRVRLLMQFEPPLGSVGSGLIKAFKQIPQGIAGQSLRRFKSLAETGRVPEPASR